MTLDSTRRAVLTTSELLEDVLSYLSPRQLFSFQRVSRQWRGVIAGSPELQEKMFLRQSATPKESWILDGYTKYGFVRDIDAYRMHVEHLGVPKFRRIDGSKHRFMIPPILTIPLNLNPIMRLVDCVPIAENRYVLHWRDPLSGVASMPAVARVCIAWKDTVSICVSPSAICGHSSLLDVCISDHPCRIAECVVLVKFSANMPTNRPEPEPVKGFRVESSAGLTIGDVVMAASESAGENYCSFDNGFLWKDLRTELKDMIDDTEQPSGWTSVYDVENITLHITLMPDGNDVPVVATEEDRAAVVAGARDQPAYPYGRHL